MRIGTMIRTICFTIPLMLQQLFATKIVIDPGHGGPGGGMYGSNGDGRGSSGPTGLTEEWVNLQVALRLRDSIES